MDKGTKIGLVIGLGMVIIITSVLAWPIYFVSQFSATYPHLKNYQYAMTAKQLEKEIIRVIKADTCFAFTITDSTGTKDDRNYYMDVTLKSNGTFYLFNITYDNSNKFWCSSPNCNLGLVGAFDKINNHGGYKDDNENVKKLVSVFDNSFITKIKN